MKSTPLASFTAAMLFEFLHNHCLCRPWGLFKTTGVCICIWLRRLSFKGCSSWIHCREILYGWMLFSRIGDWAVNRLQGSFGDLYEWLLSCWRWSHMKAMLIAYQLQQSLTTVFCLNEQPCFIDLNAPNHCWDLGLPTIEMCKVFSQKRFKSKSKLFKSLKQMCKDSILYNKFLLSLPLQGQQCQLITWSFVSSNTPSCHGCMSSSFSLFSRLSCR